MHNARTTERHLLHFQASPTTAADRELTFYAGLSPHRVQAHTRATLAEARVGNPLLQQLPDTQLSHYVEVDLPADQVMMMQIMRRIEVDGVPTEQFLGLAVHVPRETRRRCAAHEGPPRASARPHPKLEWLFRRGEWATVGRAFASLSAAELEADFLHDLVDPFETATALLAQHPGLINLGAQDGAPVYILRDCIGKALVRRTRLADEIEDLGERWSRRVRLLDKGTPVVDADGPVFSVELDERVRRLMSEPLSLALRYANQMERLRDQSWRMHYGTTTDEHDAVQAAAASLQRPSLRADETRWTLKALTRMNGVRTGKDIVFEPPREGGWTISETWSSDDATPMNADIVAALSEGRLFVRVDAVGRQGAWVGSFPAQALREDHPADFTAKHERDTAGADYATVSLTLDALRTDLEVELELTTTSAPEALASVNLGVREPNGVERILWSAQPSTRGAYGNLRVRVFNEWLRFLGAYVEFYDAADNVIVPPQWTSKMPSAVAKLFDRHPTKRYIDVLMPVYTVFGIPVKASTKMLDIPVPAGAASVKIYWGGLGTGEFDETVCACGITCTAILNLALPVILLLAGASERDGGFVGNLMKDPKVRFGIFAVGATLLGREIGLAQDPGRAARSVAVSLAPMLAQAGLEKLSIYIARKMGEGAAKRSVPLINLAFTAFDSAVTLASLGQTIAAVLQSPFYYATRLTRTFDLRVTIRPDPLFSQFPDHADILRVQVVYDAGNALPLSETKLPAPLPSTPIPVHFNEIAAGGRLRVLVFFYAANGWQSAMGASAWMDARGSGGGSVLEVELFVRNELIPLSRDSVYQHRHALTYEGGRYLWKRRPAPTAAIGDDRALLSLVGITVAQRPAMLAYTWQASGLALPADRPGPPVSSPLFAMQNISLLDDPQSRRASTPVGFTLQCGVAYDLGSSDDGSGANFYLDPSAGRFDPDNNPTGGFHLRRIALSRDSTPRFEPGSAQSWGRFPSAVDRFVVHPQGYVAGVSSSESKLYVLELPAQHSDNTNARMASLYSGYSGGDDGDASNDARAGLLARPVAIAVALDGRLLVLEDGNRRIQSFDLSGNPVPYFRQADTSEKSPLLPLRTTDASATRYLDLSVEAKGYLFVLARDGRGSSPDHYRVDIYEPDGTFLVSTPRVAAARIAVDLARRLYTLNWETWTGADGRTEPSVSLWLSPPPGGMENS